MVSAAFYDPVPDTDVEIYRRLARCARLPVAIAWRACHCTLIYTGTFMVDAT